MADYILINNYSKRGELGISARVIEKVAAEALLKVPGVASSKKSMKKKHKARISSPVRVEIHKGIVHIEMSIDVVKGNDLQVVTSKIQEELNDALTASIEQVPFNVQVKVESIIET